MWRGGISWILVSHESLPQAIELFNQAIALDGNFFDAYIARSDAYRQLFAYFEPPISMLPAVVNSLAEAQALRPDSAEAWSSLGLTYVMAWRWKDAWIALNKAKRADPTLAQTELGFALYYSALGEAEKVKRALAPPIGSIRSTRKWRTGAIGPCSWWRKARRLGFGQRKRSGNTRISDSFIQARALALTLPAIMTGPSRWRNGERNWTVRPLR